MRPKSLSEYVGQKHLVGEGCILRNMIEGGNLSSFILWGPPGVGKTTLAHIIAETLDREFFTLSAVTAGVKDVREIIDKAKSNSIFRRNAPVLFIDEIHLLLIAVGFRHRHFKGIIHHRVPCHNVGKKHL